MAQDDKYGLEPADDKYGLEPAGGGTATATAEPPSDEEIEAAYGKDVSPKIREAVKSGVAKMTPPTQFEQDRPQVQENGGFGVSALGTPDWNTIKNVAHGVGTGIVNTAKFGKDLATDISNPDKPLLFGSAEEGPQESTLHKYVIAPSEAENKKAQSGEISPIESIGHSVAAAVPLVGPWVAGHAQHAGETGNIAEELGQVGGEALAAKAGEHVVGHPVETAKLPLQIADKVVRGTPITEAGKLEAAKEQALTVKKPSISETEYSQKVNDALPDLARIAQDNAGKIKTPRQAVDAINNRISQMEAPISDHLQANPSEVVHPDEYVGDMGKAMDAALKNANSKLTPKEMDAAKAKVMELVNQEGPESMTDIEKTRRRLNTEAEGYFSSRPADKRVMDSSDATAIAQRAAGDYLRSRLYGDDANPGWLERSGVKAVDQEGNPVSMRDFRKKVGNLIDVRNHFEDAITRAEQTGDWKAFDKWRSGPSLAAGGLGVAAGAAAGGPVGALFGGLAGEGLKAWADYLKSKNPNLNVQKMFRNLENTSPPNTADIHAATPQHQYPFAVGPQQAQYLEPIGPNPAPPPFEISGENQPNRSAVWQQHVGELPPIETGAPSPGRLPEPVGPQPAREAPLGPITGEQQPLNLPGAQHELFNLPQTPRVGEARTLPEGVAGFLPEPRATELPMPGAAELAHPEMFPREPMGVEAPRQIYRRPAGQPGAGQMARGFTGEMPARIVGQTAEGGPIREGEAPPERREVGGEGREGVLQPIQTTGAAKLSVGDTFVDEKGDPRRITEITDDGTIKTQDHTLRNYEGGEIKHIGELNSPKALLAQGGMFHATEELPEISNEGEKQEEVKPMTPPGKVFRAQNVGETKLNPDTHAHATASLEEAQRYAEGRGNVEGKPQEITSVDLAKLKPEDYTIFKGPNGNDWVKFNRQIEPHEFEPAEGAAAQKKTENAPEHEAIGVHHDDLPRGAKYASVDFDAPDLPDTGKKVTAETIKNDYVRAKDRGKVSVYQSYIPLEDLPTPKFVDQGEENFDRGAYRPRVGSPIKVDIHKNGSVNILDGNHRVQVWGEQNQQYAPAWVVDHRGPNIESLSEDEKAERADEEEERQKAN